MSAITGEGQPKRGRPSHRHTLRFPVDRPYGRLLLRDREQVAQDLPEWRRMWRRFRIGLDRRLRYLGLPHDVRIGWLRSEERWFWGEYESATWQREWVARGAVAVRDTDYAEALGFTLNIDNPIGDGMRWVRLTPPGGGASIALITWNADMPPGAIKDLYLACDDIEATAAALADRGVHVHAVGVRYPVRQVRALRRSGREWVATPRGAVAARRDARAARLPRRSGRREQSTSAL